MLGPSGLRFVPWLRGAWLLPRHGAHASLLSIGLPEQTPRECSSTFSTSAPNPHSRKGQFALGFSPWCFFSSRHSSTTSPAPRLRGRFGRLLRSASHRSFMPCWCITSGTKTRLPTARTDRPLQHGRLDDFQKPPRCDLETHPFLSDSSRGVHERPRLGVHRGGER